MHTAIELRRLAVRHTSERGAGVVEWLGISALSVVMLVGLFAAVTALGDGVIEQIRTNLGL